MEQKNDVERNVEAMPVYDPKTGAATTKPGDRPGDDWRHDLMQRHNDMDAKHKFAGTAERSGKWVRAWGLHSCLPWCSAMSQAAIAAGALPDCVA